MASTAVNFTSDDAAFLVDIIHHLTSPMIVNVRGLAARKNATPNAIECHIRRLKKRYNLEISCQGTKDSIKSPQKYQKRITMGELSSDSDLPEFDKILHKAIAAPPTPLDSACRVMTVNAEGSPRKRRRGPNTPSPRRGQKTNRSPASSKHSEQMPDDDEIFENEDSDDVDE